MYYIMLWCVLGACNKQSIGTLLRALRIKRLARCRGRRVSREKHKTADGYFINDVNSACATIEKKINELLNGNQ